MRTTIRKLLPLIALVILGFSGHVARAGSTTYTIDILSNEFYPELQDAWMTRINNQGVAAGYIATASPFGPYLPATYSGNGQFQTFGLESHRIYSTAVRGINDRGDVVGLVFDADFNETSYVRRDGNVSILSAPDDMLLYVSGISQSGIAYGSVFDWEAGTERVFLEQDGTLTVLDLSAPGFNLFFPGGSRHMNAAGLMGIVGISDDFEEFREFVYDMATGLLNPLEIPAGEVLSPDEMFISLTQITESGRLIGQVFEDIDTRVGFWNADGSFDRYFDLLPGMGAWDVRFNNIGQALGVVAGDLFFHDGSSWSQREILGLGDYSLHSISDFNDRGEFVGLVRNASGSFLWGYVARPNTVVPEPGSLVLSGMGLIVLGFVARRRLGAGQRG